MDRTSTAPVESCPGIVKQLKAAHAVVKQAQQRMPKKHNKRILQQQLRVKHLWKSARMLCLLHYLLCHRMVVQQACLAALGHIHTIHMAVAQSHLGIAVVAISCKEVVQQGFGDVRAGQLKQGLVNPPGGLNAQGIAHCHVCLSIWIA